MPQLHIMRMGMLHRMPASRSLRERWKQRRAIQPQWLRRHNALQQQSPLQQQNALQQQSPLQQQNALQQQSPLQQQSLRSLACEMLLQRALQLLRRGGMRSSWQTQKEKKQSSDAPSSV